MDILTAGNSIHLRLSKIFKNIFFENEKLSVFTNNISMGKLYSNGNYANIYSIKLNSDKNPEVSSHSRSQLKSNSIRSAAF